MGVKVFELGYYKGNYAMHCDTKEKAKAFCNYLHRMGRNWRSGKPYTLCKWFCYEDETVYCFNHGFYTYLSSAKENYTILEFDDFYFEKYEWE